ncbi:hypothetical protein PIB30_042194 [Stylosanthes scabra]|uniref:Helitron helicase-like domain-containing protein n=1 Tax=Stylosanthes scabra TaxID=79078 RepID=A0ABU6UEX7_9FABA|nr:hypothetical protein [Stylosanthes scabra]
MHRNRYDLGYDYELERTLLRRRREARRARQAELEQQLNMATNNEDDMNTDNNRVTLGQYINPTSESCGSTIRRPAIQANNFELKPSLIQLVQQDQFSRNYHDDPVYPGISLHFNDHALYPGNMKALELNAQTHRRRLHLHSQLFVLIHQGYAAENIPTPTFLGYGSHHQSSHMNGGKQ